MKVTSQFLALLGGLLSLLGILGWYHNPSFFYLCRRHLGSKHLASLVIGGLGEIKEVLAGGWLGEHTSSFELLAACSSGEKAQLYHVFALLPYWACVGGGGAVLGALTGQRFLVTAGTCCMLAFFVVPPLLLIFEQMEPDELMRLPGFFAQYSDIQVGPGAMMVAAGALLSTVACLGE